jgi:chemotaxis protein MotA
MQMEVGPLDLATLLGLILGIAIVAAAIVVGGDVVAYLNLQSILIVLGGASCATMAAFPMRRLRQFPLVVRKTLLSRAVDPNQIISQIVELAEVARRDGILALESLADDLDDAFLVRGIQMAVDGSDPDVIQAIMETELENLVERHESGRALLESLGKYAPAFGMIGTLIGLVAMLENMKDPTRIGAGMAAALITTLYGALLANIVFLPLADKLAQRTAEEVLAKTITIHGVMAIQSGDNPRNVLIKLMTFVPPARRARGLAA